MTRSLFHVALSRSHLNLGWAVLLGGLGVACQKSDPNAAAQGIPAAVSASAAAAPAPVIQEAAKKPVSGCAGQYQGTYAVAPTKAAITQKEGAPAAWDKDDGKNLSGAGEIALKVDAENVISGTAKGALGPQSLRGLCDDNTLRIQMDSSESGPSAIQNAIVVAELTGDQATGNISAATGDSLTRRSGTVSLKKSQ